MGQIIKKILTDLIFFAVLICNKAESSILCFSQEFQPEFCLSKNERSQDLVKD